MARVAPTRSSMAALAAAAAACAALAPGCRGRGGGGAPVASAPTTLEARPRGEGDLVVATVDGAPIRASCVQDQLARHGGPPRAALEECVAVELLAQEALRRGLARDPEVERQAKTAAVDAVIAQEFVGKVRDASGLPAPLLRRAMDANRWRADRPPLRAASFVGVPIPEGGLLSPAVQAASSLAEELAAALAKETGLTEPQFFALAEQVVAGRAKLDRGSIGLQPRESLDAAYGGAVFAIPEIGRTSPAFATIPPRKPEWIIALWTDALPPRKLTDEELAAMMFPELRRGYFAAWVDQLGRAAGVTVTRFPAVIEQLDADGPARGGP